MQQAARNRQSVLAESSFLALGGKLTQVNAVLGNSPVMWARPAHNVVAAMFDAYNHQDIDTLVRLQAELDQFPEQLHGPGAND